MQLALAAILLIGSLNAAEPAPNPAPNEPPVHVTGTVPIRDFFRPPFINLPLVNRAGTWLIARFDTEDDHTGAMFLNLLAGKQQTIRGRDDRDIDELFWLDDRHVLMNQSHEKLYADGLFVTDLEDFSSAYAIERKSAVSVISVPIKARLKPIIWMSQDAYQEGFDRGAVQLDASLSVDRQDDHGGARQMHQVEHANKFIERTGTEATIIKSFPNLPKSQTLSFLADRNGELAFATAMIAGVESLYFLQDEKWVQSPLNMDHYDLVAAGDTDGEIIVVGPRQENKPRALLRVDTTSGNVTGTLFQDELYDAFVQRIFRHPVTQKIIGIQLYRKTLETVWFDQDHIDLQKQLNKLFPGKAVSIIGTDVEEKRIVMAVFSDRQPVEYSLLDLTKNELRRIASSAPWVPIEQMQPMQSLRYKTRDGFKVEGYLTLPKGTTKENPAPLVVLLHGGPWARDIWEWNGEVQFLASRGYAVFQPNYRGSTGYSWSFPTGDDWEFKKMHNDVTDGVKQLLKTGLVDEKRIAIMGASFGGYLALCGATYEPELYRCAITEAGVFDWSLMMKTARRNQYESVRYQIYQRNLTGSNQPETGFDAISPLKHIDQVKIPVLIAHGKDDNVVDMEQSQQLAKELTRYNVPHKVLLKKGEGHGFSRLDNKVEYYTAVEAFLAENLLKR